MFGYLQPRPEKKPEEFSYEIPDEVFTAIDFVKFCVDKTGFCWSKLGDGPYEVEMHPAQDDAFREACGVLARYFRGYGEVLSEEDIP